MNAHRAMQRIYMFLRRLFPTNDRFALWNEYGIAGEWTAVSNLFVVLYGVLAAFYCDGVAAINPS